MQLWKKLSIGTAAVVICLVGSTLLTKSFSSISNRFAFPVMTAADTEPATLAENQQKAERLHGQIQSLQHSVAEQLQAVRPAVQFLYQYHSGVQSVWFKSVALAPNVSDAVTNVVALSTVLEQDGTLLHQLQLSEHELAADQNELASLQQVIANQQSKQRGQ